ncbi:MAG: hypothetical protein Kow0059_19130 [Candidatus Sumerlaeia bacterium]
MSRTRNRVRPLTAWLLPRFAVLLVCALTLSLGWPALAGDNSGPDPSTEVEFEGIIQEYIPAPPEGPALRVADELVRVTPETQFRDQAGNPIPFSAFHVGERVRVKGVRGPDNAVIAALIEKRGDGMPGPGPEVRLVGFIENIDSVHRVLVVNHVVVETTNMTRYFDEDNNLIAFEVLAVGDFVEVEGTIGPNGSIVAREVSLEDGDDDDNFMVRFHGVIQHVNLTSGTLVVAGRIVITGNATIILDENEQPIGLGDLQVGDFVEVEGIVLRNGAVFAKKIHKENPPDQIEVRFRGVIENIENDGTLMVSGRLVRTNEQTVFLGLQNEPLTLADFSPGEFVEVEGVRQSDGSVLARRIKKEDRVCARFELRGPITAIGDVIWLIGQAPVVVTPVTVLLGPNNEPLPPSAFNVGDFVEVEGCVNAAGERVARKIKLEDPTAPPCRRDIEFMGPILAVHPQEFEIIVNHYRVQVTPATELHGPEGHPIPFDALRPGMVVKVEGTVPPQPLGGPAPALTLVIACEIHVKSGPGDPHLTTLLGRIEAIDLDAHTLVCSGTTVLVTPGTIIKSQCDDQPLALDDLTTGMLIRAEGRLLGDGSFVAAVIRVIEENACPRERRAHIFGLIRAVNLPESITVRDVTVLLRENPEIETWFGEHITPDALAVGDLVEVKGLWTPEHDLLALEIHVCASVISEIDYTSKTLVVSDTLVVTTALTDIVTTAGAPLAFEDLAVGDLVRIRGEFDGGVLVARVIVRLDGPRFSGRIGSLDEVEYEVVDGRLRLRARDHINNFGFVNLPDRSFCAAVNGLVCVDFRLSTDAPTPAEAPTARVRANSDGLRKVALLRISSAGDGRYAPDNDGRAYRFYFVPSSVRHWNLAFDLINFDPNDAPSASLTLEGVRTRIVPFSALHVVERLVDHDFDGSSNGWVFGGASPFTPALGGPGNEGTLDVTPPDSFSFGSWFRNLEIEPMAGAIYRARFVVRAAPGEPDRLPNFRLRLGTLSAGLVAAAVINSVPSPNDMPDGPGRGYDVYLAIPPDVDPTGDSLIAGFDVLQFDPNDDTERPVSLDHFTLERVEVAP